MLAPTDHGCGRLQLIILRAPLFLRRSQFVLPIPKVIYLNLLTLLLPSHKCTDAVLFKEAFEEAQRTNAGLATTAEEILPKDETLEPPTATEAPKEETSEEAAETTEEKGQEVEKDEGINKKAEEVQVKAD